MKTAENIIRKIHTKGEFYEEHTILASPAGNYNGPLLDIFCFGHSLFKQNAVIHMQYRFWIIQFQISGRTEIITQDEKYRVEPGDLLVTPPDTEYSYHVPNSNDMTKYYLIFRPSPLLEILLSEDIRQHGLKIIPQHSSEIKSLLEQISDLFEKIDLSTSIQLSILLYELICKIRLAIQIKSSEGSFYKKLNNAINELMNQKITLNNLSRSFGIGKYSLIREFNKQTGMSPVAYMISVRHKYAQQLLLLSDMSISEIAICCGYSSSAFFISEFRKHEGMTPGQYRLQNRKK